MQNKTGQRTEPWGTPPANNTRQWGLPLLPRVNSYPNFVCFVTVIVNTPANLETLLLYLVTLQTPLATPPRVFLTCLWRRPSKATACKWMVHLQIKEEGCYFDINRERINRGKFICSYKHIYSVFHMLPVPPTASMTITCKWLLCKTCFHVSEVVISSCFYVWS